MAKDQELVAAQERLSKLVARFGDENEHEVLTAARLFARVVKAQGKSLSEVSVTLVGSGDMWDLYRRMEDHLEERRKRDHDAAVYWEAVAKRFYRLWKPIMSAMRSTNAGAKRDALLGAICKRVYQEDEQRPKPECPPHVIPLNMQVGV
jgi:hypothetical protein